VCRIKELKTGKRTNKTEVETTTIIVIVIVIIIIIIIMSALKDHCLAHESIASIEWSQQTQQHSPCHQREICLANTGTGKKVQTRWQDVANAVDFRI
jgi:hypothetical protein